jgi:hypothetical protein
MLIKEKILFAEMSDYLITEVLKVENIIVIKIPLCIGCLQSLY